MAHATLDPELIAAARQGDRLALEALLRAVRPHIRRHAERRCIAHADDATQEALWTVFRKTPTLRSVAAFPIWLARIVARICLGLAGPLWQRIEALKEADATAAAEGLALDLRMDLANAVDALPDTYRLALHLYYYEDIPLVQVAARLGISETAAKVRLHRGREALRVYLAGRKGKA